MKITSLEIKNFRGVRLASLKKLGPVVVIAGANGSGKSCIYDAIRLVKSIYGGYQQNEWHQWMGEFQIRFNSSTADLSTIKYDKVKDLSIEIDFVLHPDEQQYLRDNGEKLVRESVWRLVAPELYGWSSFEAAPMAAQLRGRDAHVEKDTKEQNNLLIKELARDVQKAKITISDTFHIEQSKVLEIIFGTFLPRKIGVIDYHGPQRYFNREFVQGINLNLDVAAQQQSQHALYNYSNKYNNVKSEMAASYVKEIIAEKAGVPLSTQTTLTNTLKDLFIKFFPHKTFLGPIPRADGSLDFPVRNSDGSVHDLDELSAGEKEILFGYLRIRNSAPRYSIILIDEPEIHLNPKLLRGLPQFYHKYLGVELDNQIWLVTHSDTILREAIGSADYSLFHMEPANLSTHESQTKLMVAEQDFERAVINLVGDLAAYRPGGKVVVFEGGGDSEFDQEMTAALFPTFHASVNFISGGNKTKVRLLHEIMQKAASKGKLPFKVYSICDKDSDKSIENSDTYLSWDVFHIENFLLEEDIILFCLQSLGFRVLRTSTDVYLSLREAAQNTRDNMIREDLSTYVNNILVSSIVTKINPMEKPISRSLFNISTLSVEKMKSQLSSTLSEEKISALEISISQKYDTFLAGNEWKIHFRGRDILRLFCGKQAPGIPYERFRNLIINRMREIGYQPPGMQSVIQKIQRN